MAATPDDLNGRAEPEGRLDRPGRMAIEVAERHASLLAALREEMGDEVGERFAVAAQQLASDFGEVTATAVEAAYETVRGRLADELGIDPGTALQRLERNIPERAVGQDHQLCLPGQILFYRRQQKTIQRLGRRCVIEVVRRQLAVKFGGSGAESGLACAQGNHSGGRALPDHEYPCVAGSDEIIKDHRTGIHRKLRRLCGAQGLNLTALERGFGMGGVQIAP